MSSLYTRTTTSRFAMKALQGMDKSMYYVRELEDLPPAIQHAIQNYTHSPEMKDMWYRLLNEKMNEKHRQYKKFTNKITLDDISTNSAMMNSAAKESEKFNDVRFMAFEKWKDRAFENMMKDKSLDQIKSKYLSNLNEMKSNPKTESLEDLSEEDLDSLLIENHINHSVLNRKTLEITQNNSIYNLHDDPEFFKREQENYENSRSQQEKNVINMRIEQRQRIINEKRTELINFLRNEINSQLKQLSKEEKILKSKEYLESKELFELEKLSESDYVKKLTYIVSNANRDFNQIDFKEKSSNKIDDKTLNSGNVLINDIFSDDVSFEAKIARSFLESDDANKTMTKEFISSPNKEGILSSASSLLDFVLLYGSRSRHVNDAISRLPANQRAKYEFFTEETQDLINTANFDAIGTEQEAENLNKIERLMNFQRQLLTTEFLKLKPIPFPSDLVLDKEEQKLLLPFTERLNQFYNLTTEKSKSLKQGEFLLLNEIEEKDIEELFKDFEKKKSLYSEKNELVQSVFSFRIKNDLENFIKEYQTDQEEQTDKMNELLKMYRGHKKEKQKSLLSGLYDNVSDVGNVLKLIDTKFERDMLFMEMEGNNNYSKELVGKFIELSKNYNEMFYNEVVGTYPELESMVNELKQIETDSLVNEYSFKANSSKLQRANELLNKHSSPEYINELNINLNKKIQESVLGNEERTNKFKDILEMVKKQEENVVNREDFSALPSSDMSINIEELMNDLNIPDFEIDQHNNERKELKKLLVEYYNEEAENFDNFIKTVNEKLPIEKQNEFISILNDVQEKVKKEVSEIYTKEKNRMEEDYFSKNPKDIPNNKDLSTDNILERLPQRTSLNYLQFGKKNRKIELLSDVRKRLSKLLVPGKELNEVEKEKLLVDNKNSPLIEKGISSRRKAIHAEKEEFEQTTNMEIKYDILKQFGNEFFKNVVSEGVKKEGLDGGLYHIDSIHSANINQLIQQKCEDTREELFENNRYLHRERLKDVDSNDENWLPKIEFYFHDTHSSLHSGFKYPRDRKVKAKVHLKDMMLSYEAQRRLIAICGERYKKQGKFIELNCELFNTREANHHYLKQLVKALIKESKKADLGKEYHVPTQEEMKISPIQKLALELSNHSNEEETAAKAYQTWLAYRLDGVKDVDYGLTFENKEEQEQMTEVQMTEDEELGYTSTYSIDDLEKDTKVSFGEEEEDLEDIDMDLLEDELNELD